MIIYVYVYWISHATMKVLVVNSEAVYYEVFGSLFKLFSFYSWNEFPIIIFTFF